MQKLLTTVAVLGTVAFSAAAYAQDNLEKLSSFKSTGTTEHEVVPQLLDHGPQARPAPPPPIPRAVGLHHHLPAARGERLVPARCRRRYFPVSERGAWAISSGVPAATMRPPRSPPSGPKSTM